MPTIVVPVGDPEHMLEVTITDEHLSDFVSSLVRSDFCRLIPDNPDVDPIPLDGRLCGMGRDFHLAATVALLSMLTGRNLRPETVIPFGFTRSGGCPRQTTGTSREMSRSVRDHDNLLDFLDDVEPDDNGEEDLSVPVVWRGSWDAEAELPDDDLHRYVARRRLPPPTFSTTWNDASVAYATLRAAPST